MAVIISDTCIGCQACISQCPNDSLSMNSKGKAEVDRKKCTECGECLEVCPTSAMSLPVNMNASKSKKQEFKAETHKTNARKAEENKAAPPESCANPMLKEYKGGVWVFAEQLEGKIAGVTLELIGAANKLAEKLGVKVCAVLLGDGVEPIIPVLFEYGADKVYIFDKPLYHFYRTESYTKACCYLINKYKPEIFLVGATTSGRDLAGAVATSLRTGLTADCTGLDIDMDKRLLLASRPAFGGNIMATIVCEKHLPQMATVRPRVMQLPEPESGRKGEIIREAVEIREEDLRTSVLKIVKEQSDNIKLEDAKIIISGGRGVQNEQGFALLSELARVVGGVVAGSRGAVEKGLVENKRQVGQTGQTVSPKLYFAVGISGAIQHVVGMQGSETIVAINTDPDCPMMKLATYGIQGDVFEVLPILIEEFKRGMAEAAKQRANVLQFSRREVEAVG